MTAHLTEEELIQHFYGDGLVEAESSVDEHLRTCEACKASWNEIAAALKVVDASRIPEPDDQLERRIWGRVQQAIAQQTQDNDTARVLPFARRRPLAFVGLAAGLAAAVIAVIFAGRIGPAVPGGGASPSSASAAATVDPQSRERVLLTALDEHFQRSEMLLVEVMNTPTPTDAEFLIERETADDLLDSSRLYRVSAEQSGKLHLAQMLEDLESVLVEIARSPDQVDRTDLRSLRARIDSDDLLFKVRAVSQQVQERRKSLLTE
jgi:hypothetical protein